MRSPVVLSIAVLSTGAVLAAPHVAVAEPASKLVLTEKVVRLTSQDLGRRGLSQGDKLVFLAEMRHPDGRKLGIGGGECVLISGRTPAKSLYHCTETYRLTGGQIMAAGYLDYGRKVNQHAIIGGTGRYSGASGVLEFTEPTTNNFVDIFRFTT